MTLPILIAQERVEAAQEAHDRACRLRISKLTKDTLEELQRARRALLRAEGA